jgi:hypothetical protein
LTAHVGVAAALGLGWARAPDLAATARALDATISETANLAAAGAVAEHLAAIADFDVAAPGTDAANITRAPAG